MRWMVRLVILSLTIKLTSFQKHRKLYRALEQQNSRHKFSFLDIMFSYTRLFTLFVWSIVSLSIDNSCVGILGAGF